MLFQKKPAHAASLFVISMIASSAIAQVNAPLKSQSAASPQPQSSTVVRISDQELKDKAFRAIINEMYPESPAQIRQIKEKDKERERAIYDEPAPTPLTNIIPISLKPGSPPPVLFVAPGHGSTVTIIDATGKPWPITNAIPGNVQDYVVELVQTHEYRNIVSLIPTRNFGSTNMTFTLVNQPTPFTVRIKNDPSKYHSTPVLQVQAYGPFAEEPIFDSIKAVPDDEVLKNVVLGLGPENATMMKTSDSGVEAWKVGKWIYIRTSYKYVNPVPKTIYNGPDGYVAYKMMDIPVIYMADSKGHKRKVTITEKKFKGAQ